MKEKNQSEFVENTMSQSEFAEQVCHYVKEALPQELAEAEVRAASLDLWADGTRIVLLIIRPWNGITTGFCLDRWYERYQSETAAMATSADSALSAFTVAVTSAAAAIINDRRLYCPSLIESSSDKSSSDLSALKDSPIRGGAILYL